LRPEAEARRLGANLLRFFGEGHLRKLLEGNGLANLHLLDCVSEVSANLKLSRRETLAERCSGVGVRASGVEGFSRGIFARAEWPKLLAG